ncbi:hypothetical protein IG522_17950, partial [Vibrio cholerae]
NFDVVIDTANEYSVDMKSGLDTLQGISEATRYIAETLLTDNVPKKLTHTKKVRTRLKKSFKGSYGQVFGLDIEDDLLKRKFKDIGAEVFAELMGYFVSEALYQEPLKLSPKAEKIVTDLGEKEEALINQLRKSSLEKIHEVSTKFGHDVKLRYRKSSVDQTVLAKFDKTTVYALKPISARNDVDITASITRLNINTGNGRLLLSGESETVAFGFSIEYKDVKIAAKKKFSENLNNNNGVHPDNWDVLKMIARPMKLKNGKIVKYIIKGIY